MVGFTAAYSVHVIVGNLAVVVVLARIIPETRIWPRVRVAFLASLAVTWVGRELLAPSSALGLTGGVLLLAAVFLGIVLLFDRRGFFDAIRIVPRTEKG
jgi:hypothetical protein